MSIRVAGELLKEQQEHDARLVEKMIDDAPWKDHLMARGALTLAAHVIRRGRHLTAKEKLANLRKALDED